MQTPDDHPEFDAELAEALEANHNAETVAQNAALTAIYYQTLLEHDIAPEAAVEITCTWLGHVWG